MIKKRIIPIAALGLILLMLFLLGANSQGNYNWRDRYIETSKAPYGLAVVFKLCKNQAQFTKFTLLKKSLNQSLPAQPAQRSSYIFIGAGQFLDSLAVQSLLRFVRQGNNALICAQVLPDQLMKKLYSPPCPNAKWEFFNYYEDRSVTANFVHPALRQAEPYRFVFRHPDEEKLYDWDFFDKSYFCDRVDGFTALGYLNKDKTNFVRVPYGQGYVYLHSNPLFFTNLFMIEKSGRQYAEAVFGHLGNAPIYWDCYSKVRRQVAENMNDDSRGRPRRDFNRPSPLSYILSQPPLAWAWYLLLATTLVYFLFRIKRRQRIIPVLPSNKNNSLAFIRTIGRLYFLQNNHRQLALQKMKLFLQFVRDRYKLQTRELQEEFIHQLSIKSQIKAERIKNILDLHQSIEARPEIQERILADFHHQLESFYKNCK